MSYSQDDQQAAIEELIAKEAIRSAMADYATGVDRRRYDLVRSTYHPDAYDDHGPYKGGVDGFIEWISKRHEHVEQSLHVVGNSRIELTGDVAAVETYGIVFQRFAPTGEETVRMYAGDGEAPAQDHSRMMTAIRYVDRFERRDAGWKVARRTVVVETIWHPGEKENIPPSATWTIARRDPEDALWLERASAGLPDLT